MNNGFTHIAVVDKKTATTWRNAYKHDFLAMALDKGQILTFEQYAIKVNRGLLTNYEIEFVTLKENCTEV